MDRKTLFALVICLAIIISYPKYLQFISGKKSGENDVKLTYSETYEMTKAIEQDYSEQRNDDVQEIEKISILENDSLFIECTNHGAGIKKVVIRNNEERVKIDDITIYDSSNETGGKRFLIGGTRLYLEQNTINPLSNDKYYNVLENSDEANVSYGISTWNDINIVKEIAIEDKYTFYVNLKLENTSDENKKLKVGFESGINYDTENRYDKQFIGAFVRSYNQLERYKIGKLEKEDIFFKERVDWLCQDQKYYCVIIRPENEVNSASITTSENKQIRSILDISEINLGPGEVVNIKSSYFTGPKKYSLLKEQENNYEDILSNGFFGGIKYYILIILLFINKLFHNYGISIIVLTILIKLLFIPLTHKSFESMRKMQELQPQMKALQEKYKENPQQLNKEIMDLYKRHKANPMGGCLPLLLQMPIFIALYQTLSQSYELKGAPFMLWIKDLSEPDRLFMLPVNLPILGDAINLLPILMIGSMIWQQRLTPSAGSKEQEKIMLIMPIMFGFIFYKLPSGLVLYWLVNNMLTIAHQVIIRKK